MKIILSVILLAFTAHGAVDRAKIEQNAKDNAAAFEKQYAKLGVSGLLNYFNTVSQDSFIKPSRAGSLSPDSWEFRSSLLLRSLAAFNNMRAGTQFVAEVFTSEALTLKFQEILIEIRLEKVAGAPTPEQLFEAVGELAFIDKETPESIAEMKTKLQTALGRYHLRHPGRTVTLKDWLAGAVFRGALEDEGWLENPSMAALRANSALKALYFLDEDAAVSLFRDLTLAARAGRINPVMRQAYLTSEDDGGCSGALH